MSFEAQKSPKAFVQSRWSVPQPRTHDKNAGKARKTSEAGWMGFGNIPKALSLSQPPALFAVLPPLVIGPTHATKDIHSRIIKHGYCVQ